MIDNNDKLIEKIKNDKEDEVFTLRPQALDEFIGQSGLKDKLTIFMTASLQRCEPLDHTLFYGPPGLGKTTLAGIIAKEMKGNLRVTTGPLLKGQETWLLYSQISSPTMSSLLTRYTGCLLTSRRSFIPQWKIFPFL